MALLLDACALIAYLRDEPGGDLIEQMILEQPASMSIHTINLAEVYYGSLVRDGKAQAEEMLAYIGKLGLNFREDVPAAVWEGAAQCKWMIKEEKKRPGSLQQEGSFADCFCAAYARAHDLEVVTTDHGEFDYLTRINFCRAQFIR